jgi:phosphoribosylaminoimidazole carboxylase (NCAIR synthetase)
MPSHFPVVGVIGAGPLSRMLVAPAVALGLDLLFYAENSHDSAAQVAHHFLGELDNLDLIKAFARQCSVVTLNRATPLRVIRAIEEEGIAVRPSLTTLSRINQINENLNLIHDSLALRISVMVARSPHQQASTWTPTLMIRREGVLVSTQTPAVNISEELALQAQALALDVARDAGLVGVMAVEIIVQEAELHLDTLWVGPHESGQWTVEGSRTSQFEQHLRAILDLPLGDPSMTSRYAVVGSIHHSVQTNMYRPYLHLMARSPALKIHQYRGEVGIGKELGHVTRVGKDLLDLELDVAHAVDYMSGDIDE